MISSVRTIALLTFVAASAAAAQMPGPRLPRGGAPPGGVRAAKMLLANTGELELTDAQVVRLAAIARRAEARRRTMRATMDSARSRFEGQAQADSAQRRQFRDRMRADMGRMREQSRADQRDAIAVLTPDQQGRAWEIVSRRGNAMRRNDGMPRGGPQGRAPRGKRRIGVR